MIVSLSEASEPVNGYITQSVIYG